jgi:hypothetical protein
MGTPFQNLNFESANLPIIPLDEYGTLQPINLAMPGWSIFLGSCPFDQVLHNNSTAGTASVWIFGPATRARIFEGNYTVVLAPGAGCVGEPVGVSIEQQGRIPDNALSLQFFGASRPLRPSSAQRFGVYVNGTEVDAFTLASNQDYETYGVDIAPFRGQEVALRITSFWLPDEPNGLSLDALTFSPVSVPEPSTWALLGLGSVALGYRIFRQRRRVGCVAVGVGRSGAALELRVADGRTDRVGVRVAVADDQ